MQGGAVGGGDPHLYRDVLSPASTSATRLDPAGQGQADLQLGLQGGGPLPGGVRPLGQQHPPVCGGRTVDWATPQL